MKEHREVIELLLASDIAFYSLQKNDPQSKHAIGAKIYEYIGCGLPILVLSDEGSAVSELVKKYAIGVFVSWNDVEKMEAALRELLDTKRYAQNIQLYYSHLNEKFDRDKGIELLYGNIKTLSDGETNARSQSV
jgi:glycosyltransferase involved in cell wall biosynthesis